MASSASESITRSLPDGLTRLRDVFRAEVKAHVGRCGALSARQLREVKRALSQLDRVVAERLASAAPPRGDEPDEPVSVEEPVDEALRARVADAEGEACAAAKELRELRSSVQSSLAARLARQMEADAAPHPPLSPGPAQDEADWNASRLALTAAAVNEHLSSLEAELPRRLRAVQNLSAFLEERKVSAVEEAMAAPDPGSATKENESAPPAAAAVAAAPSRKVLSSSATLGRAARMGRKPY